MREVAIVGIGLHKFGRFPKEDFKEFGRVATIDALKNANMGWREVQAAFCGNVNVSSSPGHRALEALGQTGIPIVNVDNSCATGHSALRLAYQAVATGLYDIVLAMGFEKMPGGFMASDLFTMETRGLLGAVNPIYWSIAASKHMANYGLTREQLGKVSVKNHRNGALNPNAMYQKEMTLEEIVNSRMVCDPLTLFMMCAPNEGGAAAILCSPDKVAKYTDKPVWIAAAELAVQRYGGPDIMLPAISTSKRTNCPSATVVAAGLAYKNAGIGPEDLDCIELQDTSSWSEILHYEDLGLCARGEGGRLIDEGVTDFGGKVPVNTSGGLISKGEPVGASGLGQIHEATLQLRGQAGKRQVAGAKVALCQTTGGAGNASVVVLKR